MSEHRLRSAVGAAALLSAALWMQPASAQQSPPADPQQFPATAPNLKLPEVVVTATGYATPVNRIAGTVQIIDQDAIARSTAKSVTGLLAENAVGFMSEWSPGQTSINIRGAATEGQGRDFKSQILILINGHRAGTANVSKLSIADVERIEIVRGPSSVVYGSQNMRHSKQLPGRRRHDPAEHGLDARRRHGCLRLANRRQPAHRHDGAHRRHLRCGLCRLERQYFCLRHARQSHL